MSTSANNDSDQICICPCGGSIKNIPGQCDACNDEFIETAAGKVVHVKADGNCAVVTLQRRPPPLPQQLPQDIQPLMQALQAMFLQQTQQQAQQQAQQQLLLFQQQNMFQQLLQLLVPVLSQQMQHQLPQPQPNLQPQHQQTPFKVLPVEELRALSISRQETDQQRPESQQSSAARRDVADAMLEKQISAADKALAEDVVIIGRRAIAAPLDEVKKVPLSILHTQWQIAMRRNDVELAHGLLLRVAHRMDYEDLQELATRKTKSTGNRMPDEPTRDLRTVGFDDHQRTPGEVEYKVYPGVICGRCGGRHPQQFCDQVRNRFVVWVLAAGQGTCEKCRNHFGKRNIAGSHPPHLCGLVEPVDLYEDVIDAQDGRSLNPATPVELQKWDTPVPEKFPMWIPFPKYLYVGREPGGGPIRWDVEKPSHSNKLFGVDFSYTVLPTDIEKGIRGNLWEYRATDRDGTSLRAQVRKSVIHTAQYLSKRGRDPLGIYSRKDIVQLCADAAEFGLSVSLPRFGMAPNNLEDWLEKVVVYPPGSGRNLPEESGLVPLPSSLTGYGRRGRAPATSAGRKP